MKASDFRQIMGAVEVFLKDETGLKVLWDPQPVRSSEPHLRLTFIGTEEKGVECERANFSLSIIGAGDGPDIFLPSLVAASVALDKLYNKCIRPSYEDLSLRDGRTVRITFEQSLIATGSFSQNEMKVVETNQWSYYWNEARYLAIDIKLGE